LPAPARRSQAGAAGPGLVGARGRALRGDARRARAAEGRPGAGVPRRFAVLTRRCARTARQADVMVA